MLVTLEDIRIFRWDGAALSEVLHLPTADALSFYDPEFREKRVYEDYLAALVETWLRDVAYHWKSEAPTFGSRSLRSASWRLGPCTRMNGNAGTRLSRNSFENVLDNQRSQLRRDLTSVHATALLHHLEQAYAENVDLLNKIRGRLRDVQEKLSGLQAGFSATEFLPLTADLLTRSLADEPTKDPTDNLILVVIQGHALQNPDEGKAFLSGNTRDFDAPEIRARLATVGTTDYFARTGPFLGRFQSQPRPT